VQCARAPTGRETSAIPGRIVRRGTIANVKAALAPHRLAPQRLVGEPLATPAAVVGHLGAVQSQAPDLALWAIGRRSAATLAEVEDAFNRGDFVRTHVLRPTWHHVLTSDLPDLLELTASRIRQAMANNNRRDGLGPGIIERWAALAIEAVRTHGPLTRLDVEQHLVEAGFQRQGNSLAHVMIEAELTGEIHNGPLRGRQHTYQAADLPPSCRTPDERLAWIAHTYGRGHGPFRAKDLAWWSNLVEPLKDVAVPRALLLPCFDEYISYARDSEDYTLVGDNVGIVLRASGLLFVDGALAGSWTRSVTKADVAIEVTPLTPVKRPVLAEIEVEAERFGAFVDRPVRLVVHALG
jgi:hypothetical protein